MNISYIYEDANGNELYKKVRGPGKKFWWEPKKEDWPYQVPYQLPEMIKHTSKTIFVTEGEKDTDALWLQGFPSTCFGQAVNKSMDQKALLEFFKGFTKIVITEDNDESGVKQALDLAEFFAPLKIEIKIWTMRDQDKPKGFDIADFIKELGSVQLDYAEHIHPYLIDPPKAPKPMAFQIANADLKPTNGPQWLCDGFVPASGLTFITGAYSQGKSFLAVELGMCIAQEAEFLGMKTRPARVLYFALEAGEGFTNRVVASRNEHQPTDNFQYNIGPIGQASIGHEPNVLVRDEIHDLIKDYGPGLIIIDTFNRFNGGITENEAGEAQMVVNVLEAMAKDYSCAVLCLAHPPKAGGATVRGSGAIDAAIDALIFIEDKIVNVVKMRDGKKGDDFAYRLEELAVHYNTETEEAVTTCIVKPASIEDILAENEAPARSAFVAFIADTIAKDMFVLREAVVGNDAIDLPSSRHLKMVERDVFRQRCYEERDMKPESFKKNVQRARSKNLIGATSKYLWLLNPSDT